MMTQHTIEYGTEQPEETDADLMIFSLEDDGVDWCAWWAAYGEMME